AEAISDANVRVLRQAVWAGATLWGPVETWDGRLADLFGVTVGSPTTLQGVRTLNPLEDSAERVYAVAPRTFRPLRPQSDVQVLATGTDGSPLLTRRVYGAGGAVAVAVPTDQLFMIKSTPDYWMTYTDGLNGVVRDWLVASSPYGLWMAPLRRTAVLRMDDPQTSSKIWLSEQPPPPLTRYPEITPAEWDRIADTLRARQAVLSVMYVPGFVDDGNVGHGDLFVNGRAVPRRCGQIFNSRDVIFVGRGNGWSDPYYDFPAEFQALKRLFEAGVLDIESHGFLHTTMFLDEWCRDPTRSQKPFWMSEFYDLLRGMAPSPAAQMARLRQSIEAIRSAFGPAPVAFAPPLHQYTPATPVVAQSLGLSVMHALTMFVLDRRPIVEVSGFVTYWVHLSDVPGAMVLDGAYPLAIGMHDWDFRQLPSTWLASWLDMYRGLGIQRFIGYRELVGYMSARLRLTYMETLDGLKQVIAEVDIGPTGGPGGPESRYFASRPMPWLAYLPDDRLTAAQTSTYEAVPFERLQTSLYRIDVPAFGDQAIQRIVLVLRPGVETFHQDAGP
ncbi:MAG: hypothetical protein NZ742_07110, partial [Acidobacteria bacterium]|nr:hypothetical protein [Acidobacteriota bacterium]MDW7984605.1 hypothetical protein [Acidobacteriota bacterium]